MGNFYESKLSALEEIAAKAEENARIENERDGKDYGHAPDYDGKANESFEEEGGDDAAEQEEADRIAEEARVAAEAAEQAKSTKVRVVVDGVEEEVELDHMRKQYQKMAHADRATEKAALERKELELERREIELQRQQLLDMRAEKVKELEQAQASQAKTLPSEEDAFNKAVTDLFSGEQQQATQSLKEAINARVQSELDRRLKVEATKIKEEVSAEADKKLAEAQAGRRWEQAVISAQTKNPDLFKDPDLAEMWETKVRAAAQAGADPETATLQAMSQVETFMGRFKPAEEKKPALVNQEELREQEARKAAAKKFDVNGKTVAISAGKKNDEEKELTHSQIIQQMMNAREAVKKPRVK